MFKAAMARVRDVKEEFLQAVPQDETMTVRQAEVYFPRHPEQHEELTRNEGVLRAFRLRVLMCFEQLPFFLDSCDVPLFVMEGGGMPPSERLKFVEEKNTRFL